MPKVAFLFVLCIWALVHTTNVTRKICGTLRKCDYDQPTTLTTIHSTEDELFTTEIPTQQEEITMQTDGPLSNSHVPLVQDPSYDTAPDKYSCSLVKNGDPMCSCVIFKEFFVLTVCNNCLRSETANYIPDDYVLIYADLDHDNVPSVDLKTAKVRRLVCHPQAFNWKGQYQPNYDIGIVQLKDQVKLPTYYFPSLPAGETVFWDITEQLHLSNLNVENPYPFSSREAIWHILTKIINGRYCHQILGSLFAKDLFCIAYEHLDGAEDCKKDVGSGLVVRSDDEDTLIGLMVSKRGCGKARSVGGCIQVSKFLEWIEETVARYEQ